MDVAVALTCGGLLALFFGANFLIKGAAALARRWGLSPLVVGLTVVAGGTSSPELFVVTRAGSSKPCSSPHNESGSCSRLPSGPAPEFKSQVDASDRRGLAS